MSDVINVSFYEPEEAEPICTIPINRSQVKVFSMAKTHEITKLAKEIAIEKGLLTEEQAQRAKVLYQTSHGK